MEHIADATERGGADWLSKLCGAESELGGQQTQAVGDLATVQHAQPIQRLGEMLVWDVHQLFGGFLNKTAKNARGPCLAQQALS